MVSSLEANLFAIRRYDSNLSLEDLRTSRVQQAADVLHNDRDFVHVEERRTPFLALIFPDDAVKHQRKSPLWQLRPAAEHAARVLVGARPKFALVERLVRNAQDVGMRPVVVEQLHHQTIVVGPRCRPAGSVRLSRLSLVYVRVLHVTFQQRCS